MTPFPMIEKALREYIEEAYPAADGKTGGDPSYVAGADLYVWISLVGGTTDQIDGSWVVDVDVFAPTYGSAMTHALELEAVLLGPRKTTSTLRIDNSYQNEVPVERPWTDESVSRVGATYTLTARRSG